MSRPRILAVALAVVALSSGCRDNATAEPVNAGAFCSQPGATGRTEAGHRMVCTVRPDEDRARWREATP